MPLLEKNTNEFEERDFNTLRNKRNKKEEKKTKNKKIKWKYKPSKKTITYEPFYGEPVTKENNTYKFEFQNIEYDTEYEELTFQGVIIDLNSKFQPKNKTERSIIEKHNTSPFTPKEILRDLKKYLTRIKKSNTEPIYKKIKFLVETKEVRPDDNELMQNIKNLLYEAGLRKTHNRYLLPLENNICRPVDKNEMLQFIHEICNIRMLSTITLDKALTYFNMETKPSYHKIITKNGYFDIEENKFYTKSQKEIIINKMSPYKYDKKLIGTPAPPILKKFLDETFSDNQEKIEELLEFIGYLLDDGNRFQALLIFVGKSRSGKGVIQKLIKRLVNDKTSSVDIFSIDFNSKYAQNLVDADINFIDEAKKFKNIPDVKNYTGQGGLQIARIYEGPRTYTDDELPKTLLTTNDFKKLDEVIDGAMMERMKIFIEFLNHRPPSKRDDKLDSKIIAEENAMDWLLTNSLHSYAMVLQKGERLKAEHTTDELSDVVTKYLNPKLHTVKENFVFDIDIWDNMEKDKNQWNNFVTLNTVRNCIGEFHPEAKVNSNTTIKNLIMNAFELTDDYDNKRYYSIVTLHDKDEGKNFKFIRGLIKAKQ